jgi:hypothetical protein
MISPGMPACRPVHLSRDDLAAIPQEILSHYRLVRKLMAFSNFWGIQTVRISLFRRVRRE